MNLRSVGCCCFCVELQLCFGGSAIGEEEEEEEEEEGGRRRRLASLGDAGGPSAAGGVRLVGKLWRP